MSSTASSSTLSSPVLPFMPTPISTLQAPASTLYYRSVESLSEHWIQLNPLPCEIIDLKNNSIQVTSLLEIQQIITEACRLGISFLDSLFDRNTTTTTTAVQNGGDISSNQEVSPQKKKPTTRHHHQPLTCLALTEPIRDRTRWTFILYVRRYFLYQALSTRPLPYVITSMIYMACRMTNYEMEFSSFIRLWRRFCRSHLIQYNDDGSGMVPLTSSDARHLFTLLITQVGFEVQIEGPCSYLRSNLHTISNRLTRFTADLNMEQLTTPLLMKWWNSDACLLYPAFCLALAALISLAMDLGIHSHELCIWIDLIYRRASKTTTAASIVSLYPCPSTLNEVQHIITEIKKVQLD